LSGPQDQSGHSEEGKNSLPLPGFESTIFQDGA